MYRVTGLSLKQRSVVLLATVLIAILGVFAVTQLKTELIPDLDFPVLTVITTYPGASPSSVDAEVTQPLTTTVQALPGVKTVQSQSSENFSVVVAEFDFGTDMKDREQELSTLVNNTPLPQGAGRPDVQRINFNQFPVVQLALTGADGDLATLRQSAQQYFLPALSGLDGVSRVEVTGGSDDGLLISLDPTKLAESGVTVDQIAGLLQANNLSVPAGAVENDGVTLPVRITHQFTSVADLEQLIVGVRSDAENTPITLGELATIDVAATGAPGIARTNGEPSVAVDVYLSQGANTVDTAALVRDKLKSIDQELHAANIDIQTVTILDQSEFIQESIDGLIREAALGAGFAILVIFAFLLSIRSTLVTAISIPASVLVAFLILWWQGISLNIMTLGGLAVAIGRVVDDAIVVLESIYRHVQRGSDSRQAALEGTKEVALAITASTITTIAVFLPLGFVSGIVGEFFRPFALTVTFALLASLLVALTIVPVLASYLISKDKLRPLGKQAPVLQRFYEPILRWSLRRPVVTLVIAAVLLIGSLGLAPLIGTSFLPSGGENIIGITIEMPAGTAQDTTMQTAAELEQTVRDTVPVELLQTQVGGSGLQAAFTGAANNKANMTVRLSSDANLQQSMTKLRDQLSTAVDGAQITVSDQSSGLGNTNTIQVIVQGDDYAKVGETTKALTEQIAGVANLANVDNDVVNAKPEIVITVDPAQAMGVGSTTAQISQQVRTMLTGTTAGQITIDDVSYPATIVVRNIATDVDALKQLPVGQSSTVPLGNIATVAQGVGPVQVIRVDGHRAATISGSITSEKTGGVIADVTKIVNDYQAPEGITVSMGGVSQEQDEAFTSMGVALLIAIAMVYLAMVVSFGSLTTPFVILFSLPLAVIGVMVALFVSGKSLGLPALIGVLMLVGIVVTNAIVLLEYVIELRKRGLPLVEALVEGGKTRLRPILMTAIATILALTPLALTKNSGAIIASDLAVVVIGGLVTSTVLTLVVVPVIFELIAGRGERRAARQAEKATKKAKTATATPVVSAGGKR